MEPRAGLPKDALGVPQAGHRRRGRRSRDRRRAGAGRGSTPTAGSLNGADAIGEIVGRNVVDRFEGYYRNPEAEAERTRQRLVLVRRPRLPRRRRRLLLRRPRRRVAARRLRELRHRAGRADPRPLPRRERRRGVPRARRAHRRRPGDGRDRARRRRPTFDPDAFGRFLAAQPDLGTKWAPRYVRVDDAPGRRHEQDRQATAARRALVHRRSRSSGARAPSSTYRRLTADDVAALEARFREFGRADAIAPSLSASARTPVAVVAPASASSRSPISTTSCGSSTGSRPSPPTSTSSSSPATCSTSRRSSSPTRRSRSCTSTSAGSPRSRPSSCARATTTSTPRTRTANAWPRWLDPARAAGVFVDGTSFGTDARARDRVPVVGRPPHPRRRRRPARGRRRGARRPALDLGVPRTARRVADELDRQAPLRRRGPRRAGSSGTPPTSCCAATCTSRRSRRPAAGWTASARTVVVNAGRQPGPEPTRIEIDTDADVAAWVSYLGIDERPLAAS